MKEEILRRIRAKAWAPGDLLPGEIELAGEFGVARGTMNRALRELTEQGYLERKRKGGTRVRPSPLRAARFEIPLVRAEIEATGAVYGYELLSRRIEAGGAALRALLGLDNDEQLLRLACLHLADGKPYQLEERWISISALPQAGRADFSASGPNEWLVQTVPYSDVEICFEANGASALVARHLGVAPGTPLFTTLRTTWLKGKALTHVRLSHHVHYRMVARY
ncbi:MAG: UTRA domain-containing protein [Alphaproteobacteria bacterium]|nr:UTRA domain-containing protein [Alphaproteobacteria bacterium]